MSAAFTVTFWGVRGSVPVSSPDTNIYGGNTPCVEVRAGDQVFVLDAGTGAVALGRKLANEGVKKITLLFSHLHHDHTAGLPFFEPMFDSRTAISLYCGNLGGESAARSLDQVFGPPFFPILFSRMPAKLTHVGFVAGETLVFGDVTVLTQPINHPGGCVAYRFERNGKVFSYLTDIEHIEVAPDPDIRRFVKKSDLLVYDTMLTDEDLLVCKGWGHSTWRAGAALAKAGKVRKLAAFHHNPKFDDTKLDELDRDLAAALPGAFFSREGQVFEI